MSVTGTSLSEFIKGLYLGRHFNSLPWLERLALLLALVSRGNVWQANVPMFEAPNMSRGIVHNVSICVRAGLPKPRAVPDTERIKDTKRWITRQPRLTQIHCCAFVLFFCPPCQINILKFRLNVLHKVRVTTFAV